MATLTRAATASMDANTGMKALQYTGLYAGEALDVVAPCYIKTSDGKVYMSNGTGTAEASEFVGFTPRAVAIGQPVTLYSIGARFGYGASLSPGAMLYVSATAGRLDDAASAGGGTPIAIVMNATDIVCIAGASYPPGFFGT